MLGSKCPLVDFECACVARVRRLEVAELAKNPTEETEIGRNFPVEIGAVADV